MRKTRKQHTTDMRAAKVAGRFGFNDRTDKEAYEIACEPLAWRRVDSGNLARLATSMERIASSLSRLTAAAEKEARL